jgi:DNA-binding MarR family transcriptional regulator
VPRSRPPGPGSDHEAAVGSALDALRRTARGMRATATEAARGVSGAQRLALEKLAEGPAASLNELATRTLTQKSSLSVVVGRLVARGWVERARSTVDRRAIKLRLTSTGRRALRRVRDPASAGLAGALRRLPRRDVVALGRLLARFTAALDAGDGIRDGAPGGAGRGARGGAAPTARRSQGEPGAVSGPGAGGSARATRNAGAR